MLSAFKRINWNLICLISILFVFQLLILFVLKDYIKGGNWLLFRAFFFIFISLVSMIGIPLISNINRFKENKVFILGMYMFLTVLLISVLFSKPLKGSKRWIDIGFFVFQVSEFMKIGLIFLYAKYFSKRFFEVYRLKHILGSFVYLLIPLFLILIEPDFSSAILYLLYWFLLLIILKIKPLQLAVFAALLIFFSFVSWHYILKDYQKERVISFLVPYKDPLGSGYNIIQSKIALASGGFMGQGILNINQAKYHFLPNSYNDFVFSTFGEAFGLFGITYLFFVYFFIVKTMYFYLSDSVNPFNKIFILSFLIFFISNLFFNLGGDIGIIPITGHSLPFLSYGGSDQISFAILVGIILNIVSKNRKSGGAYVEVA